MSPEDREKMIKETIPYLYMLDQKGVILVLASAKALAMRQTMEIMEDAAAEQREVMLL